MGHIMINNQYGGQIYALFYVLAYLTVIVIFVISGARNKYPVQKLLLITGAGTLIFVLGNKLLAMPPADWRSLLEGQPISNQGGKTVLGGLVGLLIGSLLIARWLKVDFRVFDHLALGLPLGMAVTRVGCLYAGCCFGKPSHLLWAIRYPQHSHAFQAQFSEGLVTRNDLLSLSVHPTQVYDILFCLLIALIVWKTFPYWKATGSRLLLAVLLYVIARFVIEFFRDPMSNSYAGQAWFGLKYVQWGLLGGMIVLGVILVIRERKTKSNITRSVTRDDPKTWRQVSLLITILLIFYSLRSWFDLAEKTTILLVVLPSFMIMAWQMLRQFLGIKYRLITGLASVACLFLMSQTYIPDNTGKKVRFFEVGAAGIIGQYRDFTGKAYKGTDCEGDTYYYFDYEQYIRYHYYLLGGNIAYNERLGPYERLRVELSGYFGTEKSEILDLGDKNSYTIFSINPNFSYNWKNAGIDIGFHAGKLSYAHFNGPTHRLAKWVYKHNDDFKPHKNYHFMPQFGLRLGPQNIIYVDAQFGNTYPMSSPLMKFSVGLATGLGKWNGTKAGAGFCPGGLYLIGTIPIKEKYVVNALFMESFGSGDANRFNFSMAFNYRFGYKTLPRKQAPAQ